MHLALKWLRTTFSRSVDKKGFNVEEFEAAKAALNNRKSKSKDGKKGPPPGARLSKQADR